ncbi:MAG: HDOD domain-containing protein [Pseudomonadota bacterium]
MNPKIEQHIALDSLPVFPEVVLRLQELIQDENSTIPQIAEIITSSPVLLAHLLRYANSPRYSMGTQVTSPMIAINIIGRSTTISLLTTVALRDTFKEFNSKYLVLNDFVRYGIAIAATLEIVAEYDDFELNLEPIALGVLHNIGELAILHTMHDEYTAAVIKSGDQSTKSRFQRELQAFGYDHYSLGAQLMTHWGLPPIYSKICLSIPENNPCLCDEELIQNLRKAIAHTRINYNICPKWWLSEAGEFSPNLIDGETVSEILTESTERHEELLRLFT